METVNVLVAVKSKALARVIRHLLHGQAGLCVDFADSEQGLSEQVQRLSPGLIIVNSGLLGRDPSAALTDLRQANPRSKVILACNSDEFTKSDSSNSVDARVLDEALVSKLPAIVRRLTHRPPAKGPVAQRFSAVLAVFLLPFVGSAFGQRTDGATYSPPNYYTMQPPAAGSSYVDPVFGLRVKRISDSRVEPNAGGSGNLPFISDEYSSMSPFNSNNTRILGLHFSYFAVYDGSGAFIKNLNVCASCEPRWSRTNPDLLYFINGNQLKLLAVSTGSVSVVHTFSEYGAISGKGESDISVDGNHFVFVGDGRAVFVYEISSDTKGAVFDTAGRGFDSLYITPNNNVTVTWLQSGTARYNGIELFDRNMQFQRQVARAGGHMDISRDSNGDEILLWTNSGDPTPICSNAIVKVRLSDAHQTCLLSLDWSLAVHVSATDTGGWFFLETYAPSDPAPDSPGWKPYTNEVLQVKLDGTEVRRLTHHRSRPFDSYNYTPRVSASRDGTRIVFNSNFGLGGPSTIYTDVYLMELSPPLTSLGPRPPKVPKPGGPASSTLRTSRLQTSVPTLPRVIRYEQTDSAVTYSGAWSANNLSVHSGGSAALAMDSGSRFTLSFVGTGVSWIGYRDEWSGVARVYLDNALVATVDGFESTSASQTVLFSVADLASGSHTLILEATGTRNSQSGGSWIWVDAFDVSEDVSNMQTGYGVIDSGMGAELLRSFSGQDLVSETAFLASPAANDWIMYVEQGAGVSTGVAVANPNSTDANIDLQLSDGRQASLRIPAMGQRTAFTNDLFGAHPGPFLGTMKIRSSAPVAALGLRGTINAEGHFVFASIPLNSNAPEVGGTRVFPGIPDGGGFSSELILVNSASTVTAGSVQFSSDVSTDLGVNRTFNFSIPADGVWRIRTTGASGSAISGYASVVVSEGSLMPHGMALVRFSSNQGLISETSVASQSQVTRSLMFGVFEPHSRTGVAIVNPLSEAVQVTLTPFDSNGESVAPPQTLVLGALSQTSAFLDELLAGLPSDFVGFVELDAASPVYAISLRVTTTSHGGFLMSAISIVDLNRLPSAPQYFPHVVAGGSYKTEFLIMSDGAAAPPVRLFSAEGAPMAIPLQ